jgi:hypothetical protein
MGLRPCRPGEFAVSRPHLTLWVFEQDDRRAELSVRQAGQCIAVYDDSSRSSAFASFRSAVSDPLVNQQ